jgi:hypothetical protein
MSNASRSHARSSDATGTHARSATADARRASDTDVAFADPERTGTVKAFIGGQT